MKNTDSVTLKHRSFLLFFILAYLMLNTSISYASNSPLAHQMNKQQKTISIEDFDQQSLNKTTEKQSSRSEDFLSDQKQLQATDPSKRDQALEEALLQAMVKSCDKKVDGKRSSISCSETKEDGSVVKTETFIAEEVDEYKKQTVISEVSAGGTRITKRSMRHKIMYTLNENHKEVESEFFDVVTRSSHKPVIRELLIRQYDPSTKEVTKLTWTKYKQIDESKFAEIENHVALSFLPNGEPVRGRVEKWQDGRVSKTLSRWNASNLRFQMSEWQSWQNQISSMMNQIVTA